MKKLFFISVLTAFMLSAQSVWKFDVAHSKIGFSVEHLMISSVEGNFKTFDGKVELLSDNFQDSKVEFTIDAKSIFTDNDKRDEHLKSVDFFDVRKYSQLKFVSKSFKKVSGNNYKLTGELTIKNVTKTVVLDVVYKGARKDPWGNEKAGFKLTGKINRYDYGLKWNQVIEAGGVLVGTDVEIIGNIELQKQK